MHDFSTWLTDRPMCGRLKLLEAMLMQKSVERMHSLNFLAQNCSFESVLSSGRQAMSADDPRSEAIMWHIV